MIDPGVTHGPLYYTKTDDEQFVYTCDCGEETAPFGLRSEALQTLGEHIAEVSK